MMSRDDFMRYMAEYGHNIYDTPSYEGFQIFLSEQNKQIPDRRDGTQQPDTISEEKMDKELSPSGSYTHSNSLSQSKINNTTSLLQDERSLEEVGSDPERDKASSELLEEIEKLKWYIKEKNVQVDKLMEMNTYLVEELKNRKDVMYEELKKHNSELQKFVRDFMHSKFPDSFPPSDPP